MNPEQANWRETLRVHDSAIEAAEKALADLFLERFGPTSGDVAEIAVKTAAPYIILGMEWAWKEQAERAEAELERYKDGWDELEQRAERAEAEVAEDVRVRAVLHRRAEQAENAANVWEKCFKEQRNRAEQAEAEMGRRVTAKDKKIHELEEHLRRTEELLRMFESWGKQAEAKIKELEAEMES